MECCDLLVVGAGPAGWMAAIAAAENGARVVLAEYLPAPGRKLLASGAGKCNLTNILEPQEMAQRFVCRDRFLLPSLYHFSNEALREWFALRGVETVLEDQFHYFPKSKRARDLLTVLEAEAKRLGVRLICRCGVDELQIRDGNIIGANTTQGIFRTNRVILACGGKSYPALGATGRGYELARAAGHQIATPVPALVGLTLAAPWDGTLPGVIVPESQMRFGKRQGRMGELIFTHTGISGPAVLDLSGEIARTLASGSAEADVTVNLTGFRTRSQWQELFAVWQRQEGKKQIQTLLAGFLPSRLLSQLLTVAQVSGETRSAELPALKRERLIGCFTELSLKVTGTDGWKKAMATAGGVQPGEVKAGTLESRLVKGLFFAGEMLDVGAPCGGYNIQWAFSSGRLAGQEAARL